MYRLPLKANKRVLISRGDFVVDVGVLYFQKKVVHSKVTEYRKLNLKIHIYERNSYTFLMK